MADFLKNPVLDSPIRNQKIKGKYKYVSNYIVSRKIECEYATVEFASGKPSEGKICYLILRCADQRINKIAIIKFSPNDCVLLLVIYRHQVYLKRDASGINLPEFPGKPRVHKKLSTQVEDEDTVFENNLQRILIMDAASLGCLIVIVTMEFEGFAEASPGHDVEGQGAKIIDRGLDGRFRGPIAKNVISYYDAL